MRTKDTIFKLLCLLGPGLVLAQSALGGPELAKVVAPGGRVALRVSDRSGLGLEFRVTLGGKAVIEPSPLRLAVDGVELTRGVRLLGAKHYSLHETYAWRGVHSLAANHASGLKLAFEHLASRTAFELDLRACDDGAAFRFIVPGDGRARVPDECGGFNLPAGSTVWYHDEKGHYEGVHQRKPVEAVQAGEWAMPPVTCQLPHGAGYAAITEAALVNYSGMALRATGSNGFSLVLAHDQPVSYPYRLRYSTNDVERLSHAAAVTGTITTPWRVVMLGRDLNALVNADIIHNLCPPPDPGLFPQGLQTAWVRPGRAVWKYLDGGQSTLDGAKEFCRQAGELGFEYNVIEGYWSQWSDEQLKDLVSYARRHGVALWVWKHSRSLRTPEAREEFFRKLEDLGIAGAKIDFFDHEHKEVIDLYQALLRDAARHHVMVNFHGANKPTGEARTWPNELTREAVKGMEASKLTDRAAHDTTLPFTRYLAGPGDYTPTHFGTRRANTTWAHQIASSAIFDDPLLTYAANPASMLTNPAVEILKTIPAVWDETIVLPQSEIGEVAAFARRSGSDWFVAVMNGTKARKLRIPLGFLPRGEFAALAAADEPANPAGVRMEETTVKRSGKLTVQMSAGGGYIARISKSPKPSAPGRATAAPQPSQARAMPIDVGAIDRARILKAAASALALEPITITKFRAKLSEGGPNDFYSNGDYWWPNPNTTNGLPYVQRDGQTNPENFVEHRRCIIQLRDAVAALGAAYRITGDDRYAAKAAALLRGFFLDPGTRMNPSLKYAQAIPGVTPGRGIGIIDTLHLAEVPLAVMALQGSKAFPADVLAGVKGWFREYTEWMATSKNGKDEAAAGNNHAVAYWLQVACFSKLTGDDARLAECRARFKEVFVPRQMTNDGSFPAELRRTKPYGYSIFQLDNLASLCQVASVPGDDLWKFELPDGRGIRKAMEFLYPFLADKSTWPRKPDIQAWEGWPARQPCLLFAGLAFQEQKYLDLWRKLAPDPADAEVKRNIAITQPLLWLR